MDREFLRQVLTFGAFFLVLLVAFDLVAGNPVTAQLLVAQAITTILVTALYAGVLWLLRKRKK